MSIKLRENNSYKTSQESGIGENSLALTATSFVVKADSVVGLSVAAGLISWVNDTLDTFASDNETVAGAMVNFVPDSADRLYEVTITGAGVVATSEGSTYDLSDEVTVDGTTSATGGQVELVEYISATAGVFKIVNV